MHYNDEKVLSGGFVSTVTRRGDEVHRSMAERHEYVHELLRFLEERGWDASPQLLRVEPPATEVLSYLDGLSGADDAVRRAAADPSCLAALARLVRELHGRGRAGSSRSRSSTGTSPGLAGGSRTWRTWSGSSSRWGRGPTSAARHVRS